MNDYEFEINLFPWSPDRYAVDHQLGRPNAATDERTAPASRPLADLTDRPAFDDLADDPLKYGARLWKAIFPTPESRDLFLRALTEVQEAREDAPDGAKPYLRLRLCVGPGMPDLHDLRWESLNDPDAPDQGFLVLNDLVLFSRYVATGDARVVRRKEKPDLRALVVIANPSDLDRWRPNGRPLAPVDWRRELEVVEKAFHGFGFQPTVLALNPDGPARPAADSSPSLENIIRELAREDYGYDILYLVGHGEAHRTGPRLYLANGPDGLTEAVSGGELARAIAELPRRPLLVYLTSCQSAGTGVGGSALTSVGFQLAKAGVPAVVAMQGNLTMDTAAGFTTAFFQAVDRDGRLDRAMAAARRTVGADRPDRWMPVLLTRLKGGRLWGGAGGGVGGGGANIESTLRGLIEYVKRGECTPILGPGVTDHIVGSRHEIARRWADVYRYPMADARREDLPHVAQFLAVNHGQAFPRGQLTAHLHDEIVRRFEGRVPGLSADAPLDELMTAVGQWSRAQDPREPHRVLARLRCPLYITTNPDGLVADAVANELGGGAPPGPGDPARVSVGWFNWLGPSWPGAPDVPEVPVGYKPTRDQPLVYHLFGTFAQPDLMVLTQDEYFEYLIGATANFTSIPAAVRKALNASCLLFLGFQLEDWKFRVLLKSIMNRSGHSLGYQYNHVAVQLDPDDVQIQDPEMARRYLEQMGAFQGGPIRIIWSDLETFMDRLQARIPAAAARQPVGVP